MKRKSPRKEDVLTLNLRASHYTLRKDVPAWLPVFKCHRHLSLYILKPVKEQ